MLQEFVSGAATGIGSLPHDSVEEAITFVLEHCPALPAAPQLSRAHAAESMLAQAVAGIPGLHASATAITLDPAELPSIEGCATLAAALPADSFASTFEFFGAFRASIGEAPRGRGMKVQLLGPASLAIALHRAGLPSASAVLYAGAIVRARVHALATAAQGAAGDSAVLVCLDEPSLGVYANGDGPGDVSHAVDVLSGALARVDRGVTTAVHCCGQGALTHAMAAGPDVVFVPVDILSERDCFSVAEFVERGGWVGWGAIPAPGPVGDNASLFWRRLVSMWNDVARVGASPVRLRAQSLVSAACGLAGHTVAQADHVADLVGELSIRAQQQAVGVRIQLGA